MLTTRQDADAVPAPDLVNRDFTSSAVGAKPVGDITHIRSWRGSAYLAVVIDLAMRRVVGSALAERATATLATDASRWRDATTSSPRRDLPYRPRRSRQGTIRRS